MTLWTSFLPSFLPGAHFSKNWIHVSCLFHKSHLASGNCVLEFSFHISHFTDHSSHIRVKCKICICKWGIWNVKREMWYEKCEVRLYIFRWSICEVRSVKFCVKHELNFWKNALQPKLFLPSLPFQSSMTTTGVLKLRCTEELKHHTFSLAYHFEKESKPVRMSLVRGK